jgi:hypothetical protein
MQRSPWSLLLAPIALLVFGSCKEFKNKPKPAFPVELHVENDDGRPLGDVPIQVNGKPSGASDAKGVARYQTDDPDGTQLTLEASCPADAFPIPPFTAKVLRTPENKPLEYKLTCKSKKRSVVVSIRAENGPDLPVKYLDQVVAKTDRSGAAHVAFMLNVGDSFALSLDTSQNEKLKPREALQRFVVDTRDEMKFFNFKFDTEKKKAPIFIKKKKVREI